MQGFLTLQIGKGKQVAMILGESPKKGHWVIRRYLASKKRYRSTTSKISKGDSRILERHDFREIVRLATGGRYSLTAFKDFDGNPHAYSLELDRYRRHDHGGGEDGDDWLPCHEIDRDFNQGVRTYQKVLDRVNTALAPFGVSGEFDLGEKGHFTIEFSYLGYKEPKV